MIVLSCFVLVFLGSVLVVLTCFAADWKNFSTDNRLIYIVDVYTHTNTVLTTTTMVAAITIGDDATTMRRRQRQQPKDVDDDDATVNDVDK